MYLESGYSKPRFSGSRPYRDMTFEEVSNLRYGQHIEVRGNSGRVVDVKVNGAPKLWKTRSGDVRVPVKYGLKEYAYILFQDGEYLEGPLPVLYLNDH